jgi:phosphorylcholine metabolism protein LicD
MTKMDRDYLKKGQERMTNILRELDRICRKYKLSYWLNGGTLIGAIRHKGWIPLDADVDVCMTLDDFKVLESLAKKELPNTMFLQSNNTDPNYKNNVMHFMSKIRDLDYSYIDWDDKWHNGVQLDIFIFKKKKKKLTIDLNEIQKLEFRDIFTMNYNDVFPLKELEFENIKVYVQNNYVDYMNYVWGGCPPPELPKRTPYPMPHEGRIRETPEKMKKKYSYLYKYR